MGWNPTRTDFGAATAGLWCAQKIMSRGGAPAAAGQQHEPGNPEDWDAFAPGEPAAPAAGSAGAPWTAAPDVSPTGACEFESWRGTRRGSTATASLKGEGDARSCVVAVARVWRRARRPLSCRRRWPAPMSSFSSLVCVAPGRILENCVADCPHLGDTLVTDIHTCVHAPKDGRDGFDKNDELHIEVCAQRHVISRQW